MKPTLKSSEYILLLQSFKEWLRLLNYSVFSIVPLTGSVEKFLLYQEENDKLVVEHLAATDANDFMALLQTQTGMRTGKPLSPGHINKQIQALKLFSRYLRETGRSNTGFTIERMEETRGKPGWLTKPEIQALYEATGDNLLGIRDKAMLAVFYGCGLRLNEGAGIEIKDIDWTRKVLHVRKGKHYKERFVPVAEKNLEEIKLYVDYARPQLLNDKRISALFIDCNKGKALTKQSLYIRIKGLAKKAAIKKRVGTHTLRHSIATHLLQSGMKLERIQQFLGHGTIDSTQIYTHLKNEA
ncbi:MAG: site-specific tyrosine recombinase XerD [Chitinophagaceae bacterium]